MTCPDCSAWKARVEELERRLGISRQLGAIGAVMERFGCGATQARLLLRLYEAGGRPVRRDSLMQLMSTDSYSSLKSTISRLRHIVGDGFVASRPGGQDEVGWWLTSSGMSQMMAALERPEFQETRGCTE